MKEFRDITDDDQRISLMAITENKAFQMISALFEINIERLANKMLDPKTSDHDTLILKGMINEAKRLAPIALRDTLITKIESRLAKSGVGVVVFNHAGKNGK